MDNIVEVHGLKKSYGEVQAVRGIDFHVERSSMFAFLGPNGAGKSTTIDMLVTLLKPDSGDARIAGLTLGEDDAKIRSHIGVVFQQGVLDPLLTVKENLVSRAALYGRTHAEQREGVGRAIAASGVSDFVGRRYGKLSGGQQRRADIARALVCAPDILFLDEPTTGLDPQTRIAIWDTVRELQQQQGMTVFLTTHYMEEAADADYVCIIDDGLITAHGTPDDLKHRYGRDRLRLFAKDERLPELQRALTELGVRFEQGAEATAVELGATMDALEILDRTRHLIVHFEVIGGNMDDAFIAITGKELRG